MTDNVLEFDEILERVTSMPLQTRVRLVERVLASVDRDLEDRESAPKRSLYGLWSGVSISAEEIDEARQEMWANFPREDI
jgi:hypothetical protein